MRAPLLAVTLAATTTAVFAVPTAPDARSAGAHASVAQQQAAPPAPAPAPQRGGRRPGVQVMTLTTSAWQDGGLIPKPHTQVGEEISPPLAWDNVPNGAGSFVLIVHDTDALRGSNDLLHWLVWNIPGTARSLQSGVPQGAELPDGMRQISATGPNYRGPGAPAADPPHHYLFELYALAVERLGVPAVGASPEQTRQAIVSAMSGQIRGKATLVGRFRRGE
jgi:Raf kinase inhibitor-like YbhB/YbcL family protein